MDLEQQQNNTKCIRSLKGMHLIQRRGYYIRFLFPNNIPQTRTFLKPHENLKNLPPYKRLRQDTGGRYLFITFLQILVYSNILLYYPRFLIRRKCKHIIHIMHYICNM